MFSLCPDLGLDEFTDDECAESDNKTMMTPVEDCLIGDHVVCNTVNNVLTDRYEKSGEKITLAIVGKMSLDNGSWEYLAYIPDYETALVQPNFRLRHEFSKRYGLHVKYIGEFGCIIGASNVIKISYRPDGLTCTNCEEFFEKSGPNQEDGTLICWGCRQNPWR